MAVLLTGGTGLLGANLAHRLCALGTRPRLLLRERSDKRGLRGLAYEEAPGDLLNPASLERAMKGAEGVVHAAGLLRLHPGAAAELWRVNVDGTRHVLEAARRAGVRRLVYVSSVATVGAGPLSRPGTEEDAPPGRSTPYAESKREAEALVLAEKGLECVVANPAWPLGAYDARPSSSGALRAVARGRVLAYPSGGGTFVNAADVAEGLRLLMERGRAGERYLLGGENLTFRALLAQCAEEAGVRPPLLPLPDGLFEGAGAVTRWLGRVLPAGLGDALSPALLELMTQPAYVSSAKATRELGYRPRPVRLGIREALRWFQEEGLLPRDQPLSPHGALET